MELAAGTATQLSTSSLIRRKLNTDSLPGHIISTGLTQFRRQTLHWLNVADRIRFRLCVQVYKCQHGMAPAYLDKI